MRIAYKLAVVGFRSELKTKLGRLPVHCGFYICELLKIFHQHLSYFHDYYLILAVDICVSKAEDFSEIGPFLGHFGGKKL